MADQEIDTITATYGAALEKRAAEWPAWALGGAALGAGAGALSAYTEEDESKLYKTMLRRALIGALTGGAAGTALPFIRDAVRSKVDAAAAERKDPTLDDIQRKEESSRNPPPAAGGGVTTPPGENTIPGQDRPGFKHPYLTDGGIVAGGVGTSAVLGHAAVRGERVRSKLEDLVTGGKSTDEFLNEHLPITGKLSPETRDAFVTRISKARSIPGVPVWAGHQARGMQGALSAAREAQLKADNVAGLASHTASEAARKAQMDAAAQAWDQSYGLAGSSGVGSVPPATYTAKPYVPKTLSPVNQDAEFERLKAWVNVAKRPGEAAKAEGTLSRKATTLLSYLKPELGWRGKLTPFAPTAGAVGYAGYNMLRDQYPSGPYRGMHNAARFILGDSEDPKANVPVSKVPMVSGP